MPGRYRYNIDAGGPAGVPFVVDVELVAQPGRQPRVARRRIDPQFRNPPLDFLRIAAQANRQVFTQPASQVPFGIDYIALHRRPQPAAATAALGGYKRV